MRCWQAILGLWLGSSLLAGCGCETYKSYVRAHGVGYPTSDPERTTKIEMDWTDVWIDGYLDARPKPGVIAVFCLSAEKDSTTDVILVLDYGLDLGVRQTGMWLEDYFGHCQGAGLAPDPMITTWVYGRIELGDVTVEIDRFEAVSTSLQPPRYDVRLTGQGDDGVEYAFDLELSAERIGNAMTCD